MEEKTCPICGNKMIIQSFDDSLGGFEHVWICEKKECDYRESL